MTLFESGPRGGLCLGRQILPRGLETSDQIVSLGHGECICGDDRRIGLRIIRQVLSWSAMALAWERVSLTHGRDHTRFCLLG